MIWGYHYFRKHPHPRFLLGPDRLSGSNCWMLPWGMWPLRVRSKACMPMAPRSAIASRRWKSLKFLGAWRHMFLNHISQGKPKETHRNTKILGEWWGDSCFFLREMWPWIGDNILVEEIWQNTWDSWCDVNVLSNLARIIPTCGAGLVLAVWSNSSLRKRRQNSNERKFLKKFES